MDKPNYVLRTNEATLERKEDSNIVRLFRVGVLVVVAIIVMGSFIFQENLLTGLSWTTRCLLIAVAIGALLFGKKKEDVPSPIEIQFYDNYLILYRPMRVYNKKVTRMEINKMMYSDIKKCVFKTRLQRVHIYGRVYATWYNFNTEGCVSQTPTYDRVVEDTLCFFRTLFATDIDFKKEIEEHSPIKVIVENS